MTAENHQPGSYQLPAGGTAIQCRIADAAIELFYARGATATTVREITAACGLTPGALYNHFASKDQLLYLLVRDVHQQIDEQVAAAVAEAGEDPARQLAACVHLLVAHSSERRKPSKVANREFTALTRARHEEIVAIRRRMRGRLTEIIEAGTRSGRFSAIWTAGRVDAALTANVIAAMCVNVSELTTRSHALSVPELQDRYVRMALRLVGAEPAAQPPGRAAGGSSGSADW